MKKLGWLPSIEEPEKLQQQKETLLKEAKSDPNFERQSSKKSNDKSSVSLVGKKGFSQAIHHF